MLVLERLAHGRGHDESTIVVTTPEGRRILVHLISTERGSAKVGVEADKEVVIHRAEIQRQIDQAAAGV